jgi:hypothetical protein
MRMVRCGRFSLETTASKSLGAPKFPSSVTFVTSVRCFPLKSFSRGGHGVHMLGHPFAPDRIRARIAE